MIRKFIVSALLLLIPTLSGYAEQITLESFPPVVVKTVPQAGASDVHPALSRIEVTFSKELFWNTLIQYSSQGDFLGINSRLQWRFAPLSDVHLVYNDNYDTEVSSTRFRSISLKLTYWLDI